MKALVIGIMMLVGLVTYAQTGTEDMTHQVRFFHQIFLDDTIQSVEKVVYADDNCDITFKLSDDKTAIYLLNYDGKRSIHAFYTDKQGLSKDVKKATLPGAGLKGGVIGYSALLNLADG